MKNVIWFGLIVLLIACGSSNKLIEKPNDPDRVIGQTSKLVVYDEPPIPIKKFPPSYPEIAKSKGIEGEVWLEVELLVDGSVGTVEIKQSLMPGPNGLDQAAINCVKKWVFSPAKHNGKPVACWVTFPMRFSLK